MSFQKRVLIVVGTRPNFIKITQFEKEFAKHDDYFDYQLLHTGQHYDQNMSKVFFDQFQLKQPDFTLNIQNQHPATQVGNIIIELEKIVNEMKPDMIMVPGDVNSTLAAAICANKCGIPLAHIESGLRSFDREMPEEINRLLTDEISDMLLVTENSGLENLKKEGKKADQVHFVGNTMIDTLVAFDEDIQNSDVLSRLNLVDKDFALMTMHRPRNVDTRENLQTIIQIIEHIISQRSLVFAVHPRTLHRMKDYDLYDSVADNDRLIITEALDYLSFQKLISSCSFVVTDSGGIQEETTFRKVPCLTLRNNTERPSTITLGTNQLVKLSTEDLIPKIEQIESGVAKKGSIPPLWDGKATERIVTLLKEQL